ncbi:MAG: bifunctional folylpolyglutamate synthase/dihydrofolate synthase [Brachyspira sp.]|nr:bifunctional folylpolyglutamate synthase/dihydrofolate synthase [Brachyspira sp.]
MENGYKQAVELLTSQGKFYINLGLERISALLELLGNPQDELKFFHVAGTNGKGSVCSIMASVLQEAGKSVGLYTSPHIFNYTERIKINGVEISKEDFARLVFEICTLAENNNIHLTEFEILTAVMFKYFADKSVDVVVLETGLGGRYDATNVIKNNLCAVITHIDLDHTERLGNTKDKIAFEKAGIIKPNCPVVTCEGYEAIKDRADECNSLFLMVAPFENTDNLSLKGTFQQENLSLALAAVRLVFPDIPENLIQEGLKKVKHPCRFQLIGENLIVDGSHNPNGAMALRESLDFYYPDKKRRFVFGCLRNKDYKKMMEILFDKNDEIYFNHFSHQNSASFDELQQACSFVAKTFTSLSDLEKRDDTLTIVCGSFYMLNEVIPLSLLD